MQSAEQDVPRLLCLLEQASISDEQPDKNAERKLMSLNENLTLGSLIDVLSDNDEELEMIHINSELTSEQQKEPNVHQMESEHETAMHWRNKELCSILAAALSNAAANANVTLASIPVTKKFEPLLQLTTKSDMTHCSKASAADSGYCSGGCNTRSRAIPNTRLLMCNEPAGSGLTQTKSGKTTIMCNSSPMYEGTPLSSAVLAATATAVGSHRFHSPPCKRIKLHHRPCLDFEKMHKQKQTQEKTSSTRSNFTRCLQKVQTHSQSFRGMTKNLGSGSLFDSCTKRALSARTDQQKTLRSHLDMGTKEVASLKRGSLQSATSFLRAIVAPRCGDHSSVQAKQEPSRSKFPQSFISHFETPKDVYNPTTANNANSNSSDHKTKEDQNMFSDHSDESITDIYDVIENNNILASGGFEVCCGTEAFGGHGDSNDSAYASDIGVASAEKQSARSEQEVSVVCETPPSSMRQLESDDERCEQQTLSLDGNGNMIASEGEGRPIDGYWSDLLVNEGQNIKYTLGTSSSISRLTSKTKSESLSNKLNNQSRAKTLSHHGMKYTKGGAKTVTQNDNFWSLASAASSFTPINIAVRNTSGAARTSPVSHAHSTVNNLALPVAAACTPNVAMFGGAFINMCTTGAP